MIGPHVRTVAVLVVLGAVVTGSVVGLGGSTVATEFAPDDGSTPGDPAAPADVADRPGTRQENGSANESAPSGGVVSSVIGMEEASVDGTVAISRFETRFSAAETDAERAAAVADSLDRTRARVTMLEDRLETLQARRANGSITEGWFAVELSWLRSSAENQRAVAVRLERAARTVPGDALARRNASVQRIQRVAERADRLLDTEPPEIHRTSFDRQFYADLATLVGTLNESAESTDLGVLGDLTDGERVNLYVGPEVGQATVVSFRTTEDSRITDFRAGTHPDATVSVRMDERTARRILDAEDPGPAFGRAVVRGDVAVRGIGPVNRLKWGVRKLVLAVVRIVVGLAGG